MLEVIEAEKINVEIIITESKHHTDKPLSRISFIETPPVSVSPRNTKLEPSLDTVDEMSEISITQETDIADTVITTMEELVNNVLNTIEQQENKTVLEDINIKVDESKSFKNKIVKFYKNLKNRFSCFVKNI